MNKGIKVVLGLALAIIIGAGGFIGGFVVAKISPAQVPLPTSVSNSELGSRVEEVNGILQRQALKPPTETSATAGAVQGLLEASGDKYGTYFDPRHYKFFNEDSAGEFGGIGVVLGEKEGTAYVVEVYKDTPAFREGIKAGDIFHSIDGVTRTKWTTQEVVKRVRGEESSKVKLVMLRPSKDKTQPATQVQFTVTRAMISLPNVESELKGDVGYIRLYQFNAKATEDVGTEVKQLEKKGAKAFVLDLRDNPGGLLQESVDFSSLFVGSGVIVKVEERGKDVVELRATGDKITDKPLFVLINGNSASASEIVSGALQDYKRAKLVGEKSFGKGSVQSIEELSFGGAVKFTTAHYLTPKNRAIDGKGLVPDIAVKMDPEKQMEEKTDIQLQKALDLAEKAAR